MIVRDEEGHHICPWIATQLEVMLREAVRDFRVLDLARCSDE
jgi:hypothetical protein